MQMQSETQVETNVTGTAELFVRSRISSNGKELCNLVL